MSAVPMPVLPDLTTTAALAVHTHDAARNRAVAQRYRDDAAALLAKAATHDGYAQAADREAEKLRRYGAEDFLPCRREGAHQRAQRHPRTDCPCGYAETGEPVGPCGHALCAPHGDQCLMDGRTR